MSCLRPILALLASACLLTCHALPAFAEQHLREVEGMPFSLEIGNRMQAKLLPLDDPSSYSAASVMPRNISELDVVQITWPRSKRVLKLSVGNSGQRGGPREQFFTAVSVSVDSGKATLAGATRAPLAGTLNRICVWPSGREEPDLVVVFSLAASGTLDSAVHAFRVSPDGTVNDVSTNGALSAFGGFDLVDLDNNDTFELVTARNLDGMPGGFSYHAVRSYESGAYNPAPDAFKETYYRSELNFINWVVETRAAIQANPEPYMGKSLYGFYYVAEYQKEPFGFDSLIELPPTAEGQIDLPRYNKQRADAFRRVVNYRDELQSWLAGGERPATWKLTR